MEARDNKQCEPSSSRGLRGRANTRAGSKRSKNAAQTGRLLALAAIYDGGSRSDAAKIGGVGLQTVRDWVLAFNAVGPPGLVNGKARATRHCSMIMSAGIGRFRSEAGGPASSIRRGAGANCALSWPNWSRASCTPVFGFIVTHLVATCRARPDSSTSAAQRSSKPSRASAIKWTRLLCRACAATPCASGCPPPRRARSG